MTFHDPRDAQRYRARLRKQKEYQRTYRAKLIMARTPERAEIASACLSAVLVHILVDAKLLGPLPKTMIDHLERRGFDRQLSVQRISEMAKRLHRNALRSKGA